MMVFGLHQTFFSFLSTPAYFHEARLPLNIVAGSVGLAWLIWVIAQPAPWNADYELKSAMALGCARGRTAGGGSTTQRGR